MKNMLFGCALLSLFFCAQASVSPMRVLAIGNSYTRSLESELQNVAKAAGVNLDLAIFAIGGRTLSNHWINCEAALKDPSVKQYWVRNRGMANLPEMLADGTWDVIALQEQSEGGMYPDRFDPWADRLVALIRERQPKAKLYFQLTWADPAFSPRITNGRGGLGLLKMTQDEMASALEKNYTAQAKRLGLRLIPVGPALQLYRKRLPVTVGAFEPEYIAGLKDGEVPDIKGELSGWFEWSKGEKWHKDYGVHKLRKDHHHLNREGKYLQACVWVSSLTGKDLTNLSYVPDFGVDFQRRASLIRRCAVDAAASFACTRTIKMLPDEKWWGLCNAFGREMPFSEKTVFSCDLRRSNYSHQSLSLLCSDKGRVVWCAEPVGVKIENGKICLESDKGEIIVKDDAGRNLNEAFRYASKTWFAPTGEEPELLYFSAPQYNTWIELTYHQNEKDILSYAKSMLDNGLPPGVFMIDDTWQHGYGEWYFDMRRFHDPKGMMDNLHAMGFKVLLWMCPFVSMDTPAYRRIAFAKNPDDVRGYPTKGGFLVSSQKPGWGGVPPPAPIAWWNGRSALLDFTHPNAVAWFTEQLDRLVKDYGADGFKFDGGGVQFYAGCVGTEGGAPKTFAHDPSVSPVAQSALYGNFALKYKGSEYRNGFGFAGKPVIMRLHDKAHSWDALRRLVPDMMAAGFVGCPFICPDMIGGGEWTAFLPGAPFDSELFIRSAQIHALCPMMQISASPWRVLSKEHQRIFKDVANLRQRFAPCFVELAKESSKTGEPMMRNMEYCFPGMGYAEIKDQFMMGNELLVAPVVEKGVQSRKVVLPPGKWRSDDGQTCVGPAVVEVAAPLARLPYFEKLSAQQ